MRRGKLRLATVRMHLVKKRLVLSGFYWHLEWAIRFRSYLLRGTGLRWDKWKGNRQGTWDLEIDTDGRRCKDDRLDFGLEMLLMVLDFGLGTIVDANVILFDSEMVPMRK